jgi:4'-phosphopantetheinyl transferase EntD
VTNAPSSAALSEETSLLEALIAIAPAGVLIGCRAIRDEDEAHLMPAEAHSIPARHPAIRRASGAARWIAHGLLMELGQENTAVLRAPSGAPVWPDGVTGSLAHDEEMAVAVVASVSRLGSVGIDVEPAIPLTDDVLPLVATQADMIAGVDAHLAGRLLFSAKEAVYKAVYSLDGVILNYEDIAVNLNTGHAMTTTGRTATLTYCIAPRIVVLALVSTE